jgi:hypothetical protein
MGDCSKNSGVEYRPPAQESLQNTDLSRKEYRPLAQEKVFDTDL